MTQLNEKEKELAALLSDECQTPAELTAKLKNLFAGALEKMLEGEMDEHLGYEKNSVSGIGSGNSRNGYGKKTVKSEWGESEIVVPRDRNGSFEPQIIEKRQTRTDDIEMRRRTGSCTGPRSRRTTPSAAPAYSRTNISPRKRAALTTAAAQGNATTSTASSVRPTFSRPRC